MSTEQRVAALEALLGRVQARAQERPARHVAAAVSTAAAPVAAVAPLELDDAFPLEAKPNFDDPAPASRAPLAAVAEAAEPISAEPISAGPASTAASEDFEEIEDLSDVEEVQETGEFDLDEPAPASHSSPVATSLEQAFASAAAAPPLTPPPESGPEPAHSVHAAHPGPTMEQLGATISLEEGPTQSFERDEPLVEEPVVPSSERELEADLAAPNSELLEVEPARSGEPPIDLPASADLAPAELAPQLVARPAVSAQVVEISGASPTVVGDGFLDVLDAALSL
ncbi:MAG TPA: hypothetical protein VLC09_15010 [Polyangiaceae bacterium]|nr:hypothetical protein [Polyangiaceae bacterium]